MKKYNGHRSWNAWNVSWWINNNEDLYNFAVDCRKNSKTLNGAVRRFINCYGGMKTPDGAAYNAICVREAIKDIID